MGLTLSGLAILVPFLDIERLLKRICRSFDNHQDFCARTNIRSVSRSWSTNGIFKDVLGDGRPNRPQVIGHESQSCAIVFGIDNKVIGDQLRFWVTPLDEMTPDTLRKVYQDN